MTLRRLTALVAAVLALTVLGPTASWSYAAGDASGGKDTDRWTMSFDNEAMNSSGAGTVATNPYAVTGSVVFKPVRVLGQQDPRTLEAVTATIVDETAPDDPDCTTPTVSPNDATPPAGSVEFAYTFSVTSPCNQTARIAISARTTGPMATNEQITADITFAVPATPVTSLSASVPDIDSREVTVTWETPEGSEPDTTYRVERQGPDSDEWTDLGDENEIVDEIDDDAIGIYTYRVVATRPLVEEPVPSAPVEVPVGVEPPTTTTPDDGGGAGDGTTTTVTMPDAQAPITVPRRSSTVGNRGVSTHTTVGTAPRSPATTIDTGFEETLDYHLDDVEPGELAAEGQSILSADPESSVIGPGAIGASVLVLVGWAGHYLYFRRLAAQF